jgi:hypothetical protein
VASRYALKGVASDTALGRSTASAEADGLGRAVLVFRRAPGLSCVRVLPAFLDVEHGEVTRALLYVTSWHDYIGSLRIIGETAD